MSTTHPVVSGNFAYQNESFYAESSSSNQKRHPRAPLAELRALFRPATTKKGESASKDHPGHWYEAQLLHYGLPPSKTKAVAKTRLLDAVNKGNLAVPAHLVKLEAQLKKEWLKHDRAAKKHGGNDTAPSQSGKTQKAAKAKQPARKTTSDVSVSKPRLVGYARKTASNVPSRVFHSPPPPVLPQPPRRKQTARKRAGNVPPEDSPPPTGKKRRAQSNAAPTGTKRSRIENSADPFQYPHYGYDDSYAEEEYTRQSQGTNDHGARDSSQPRRLGLLNGVYDIESEDLNEWPDMFDEADFSLTLCIEGSAMWGAYDFGMHSGIMYLSERPWTASDEPIYFTWRGQENSEGQMSFHPNNEGWIRFQGDGAIEGMITCYGQAMFYGQRVSGGETRAPRDARSMRNEWNGYNQREYDRAARARWGGSGW